MRRAMTLVGDFHRKYGFERGEELRAVPSLGGSASAVALAASSIDAGAGLGQLRAHLVLEEAAELVQALADGDRLALLDALADLTYVVVGTAVAYGLPLAEAFDEVHRSNMTKTLAWDRDGHPGKGDGYSPPDLRSILDDGGLRFAVVKNFKATPSYGVRPVESLPEMLDGWEVVAKFGTFAQARQSADLLEKGMREMW